jgi:hypothetical protein
MCWLARQPNSQPNCADSRASKGRKAGSPEWSGHRPCREAAVIAAPDRNSTSNSKCPSRVPISVQPREPEVWAKMKGSSLAALLFLSLAGVTPPANANVTILLEEPYSYDGALAGTGHTAVYLTRVCAATPVTLRRCNPGEHGAVISRYTRIAGYDWIAIPLVPYLYAVENPEDVPLYAEPKLVGFLRDQYRRAHLEDLAPDAPGGEMPKGDWSQLIGSSYDRTNYGFEIETTPEQDDTFIAWLNSRPNRASYKVVSRNCADFVRDVLDFYYPKSVSRGAMADLFVSTPKHAAKSLAKYSRRHPDLEFTQFVIPQVPGGVKRSRPVRGVLESVFRAKKYAVVLAAFHPFLAGGVVSVDLVSDRFNSARNMPVFSLTSEPLSPPTNAERRAYLKELQAAAAKSPDSSADSRGITWRKFVEKSQPEFDANGQSVLQAQDGNEIVKLGVTRRNLQSEEAPVELQKELMVSRLEQNLAHSRAPRISSGELREDWFLLKKIEDAGQENLSENVDPGNQAPNQTTDWSSD